MSDFGYPLQSHFSDLAIGAPEYEFRTNPTDTDDGVVFLIRRARALDATSPSVRLRGFDLDDHEWRRRRPPLTE